MLGSISSLRKRTVTETINWKLYKLNNSGAFSPAPTAIKKRQTMIFVCAYNCISRIACITRTEHVEELIANTNYSRMLRAGYWCAMWAFVSSGRMCALHVGINVHICSACLVCVARVFLGAPANGGAACYLYLLWPLQRLLNPFANGGTLKYRSLFSIIEIKLM